MVRSRTADLGQKRESEAHLTSSVAGFLQHNRQTLSIITFSIFNFYLFNIQHLR